MSNISIRMLEMAGIGSALQALRLPFGRECRSDVRFSVDTIGNHIKTHSEVEINVNDSLLLSTLITRGDEHAKVLRGVVVWLEIDAPRYWWMEEATYRIGAETLSSTSTMHCECRGMSEDELVKAKGAITEDTHNKRVVMYSYQALRRIWWQRHNHRLPQWRRFCEFIESLPYANELILAGLN